MLEPIAPNGCAVVFDGHTPIKPEARDAIRSLPTFAARERQAREAGFEPIYAEAEELETYQIHVQQLIMEMALYDALLLDGLVPTAISGSSLGQIIGLVAAGIIAFELGLHIVRERAQVIADATKDIGALSASILLKGGNLTDQIEEVARELNLKGAVYTAIINSPSCINITGRKEPVQAVAEKLKADYGARFVSLELISHSPLMRPYALRMKRIFDQKIPFEAPRVPVISDLDGQLYRRFVGKLRVAVAERHLVQKVDWPAVIVTLQDLQVSRVASIGLEKPYLARYTHDAWPEVGILPVYDQETVKAANRAVKGE